MTLGPDEVERRQFAIAHAIRRAEVRSAVVPFLVATVAVGVVFAGLVGSGLRDLLDAVGLLVGVAVFMPISLALGELSLPAETRAAIETFQWIGHWEWLRFKEVGGDPPLDAAEAVAWLPAHPVSRDPGWVEVHVRAYDLAGARAAALALPSDTAWERFERTEMLAWLDWVSGGAGDLDAARKATEGLTDPEECLRAAAKLAAVEARIELFAGRDWRRPLAELRPRIGDRIGGGRRPLSRRLAMAFIVAVGVSAGLGFVIGRSA